ncbi:putative hemolysin [Murinocardiopsis flavida]|uniref:Putative hemolysin n=1 Tax=Murinocardiopsis flavida TaxID=645275 RepID=A0A2P8D160_9ACTN|nr:hemolysin family protein [Murinocardiopsis flavida]PSK90948.1 putative hemolysin [Murinocardiopsis flavida]
MDAGTWVNIALVVAFVLLGGLFAGTELALVSLRESQLRQLERRNARGAKVAAVARNPNRFLSAVQIGVTVTGFFSAAYGASTLAPDFAPLLVGAGLPQSAADGTALVALTLLIAYLSLVLGELVPKRFALQRSVGIALVVAPPLDRFAILMRPVIWLLSVSTNMVVRLLGGDPTTRSEEVSREELREMVSANEDLARDERDIVADVFQVADRTLREVMRPRVEVAFLPADMSPTEAKRHVAGQPYSRYPITGDDTDDVIGFLHVRDLLTDHPAETALREVMRPIVALPTSNLTLPSLTDMRNEGTHIAVVVNEYGGTAGIVTLEDLVEELIGDIRDEYDPVEAPATDSDGADTYDAGLRLDEFTEQSGVELAEGPYETVAGFIVTRLRRLARQGDTVTVGDRVLRVTETSGNRIRQVEVQRRS